MFRRIRLDNGVEITTRCVECSSDDLYTDVSNCLMDALVTGEFENFENLLDDNVLIILYGVRTIRGKVAVMEYWRHWREKFVLTGKVKLLNVLDEDYDAHTCLRIDGMKLVKFQTKKEKVTIILILQERLTDFYSDYHKGDRRCIFEWIKPYMKLVENPTDEDGYKVVMANRIPCLTCGIESADLTWYVTKRIGWNKGWGYVLVSVCPKCGQAVEYVIGNRKFAEDDENERKGRHLKSFLPFNKKNVFSGYVDKIYLKVSNLKDLDNERELLAWKKDFKSNLRSVITDVKPDHGYRLELTPDPSWRNSFRLGIVDIVGNASSNFCEHLYVESTEMAAWQLYLMERLYTVMPDSDYYYCTRKIILKPSDINRFMILPECRHLFASKRGLLLPSVKVFFKTKQICVMIVSCCYWNDWDGLVRERVIYTLRDGRVVDRGVMKSVLYSFDCGILF